MARYINQTANGTPLPSRGKVSALLADGATMYGGALRHANPDTLVCVVDNGKLEVAVWVYDASKVADLLDPQDRRHKVWMVYPRAKQVAKRASGGPPV
jgi:hypothetical protein